MSYELFQGAAPMGGPGAPISFLPFWFASFLGGRAGVGGTLRFHRKTSLLSESLYFSGLY